MFDASPRSRLHRTTFVILLLSLAACTATGDGASAAGGAEANELPAGWTRVVVADGGFSIGVPDGWNELSTEDIGESGIIDEMASANPAVADTLSQAQDAIESGQIAFFAFDAQPDDTSIPFAANVNVLNSDATDVSAADAAEQMAEGIRGQIPVNGEVESDTASLPAGESAVVRYQWTLAGGGGVSTDVAVTQYAVLAQDATYILSFTAPVASEAEYAPIFEQMAESFEEE